MMLVVYHAARLELEVGDADSVFYEQDILCAFHMNVQGAFFVPLWRRCFLASSSFKMFDGHVGKRLVM